MFVVEVGMDSVSINSLKCLSPVQDHMKCYERQKKMGCSKVTNYEEFLLRAK